jgi:hypothetical protein
LTSPFLRFPDIQRVLVEHLAQFGNTAIETPQNLNERLPFVRIVRTGGGSGLISDGARFEVDVFAGTYLAAEQLAEQIRQYLCGPPPGPHALDRVECLTGPRELPWDDDGLVRRWSAEYGAVTRRRVTT